MVLDGGEARVMDLHRCQIQGYLKAIKAVLYALEEDCELFKGLPNTHIGVGDILAQVEKVMGVCDTEFLEQVR